MQDRNSGPGGLRSPGRSSTASGAALQPLGERPQIIFSLVTRGQSCVLAEYTSRTGNFEQATHNILERFEPSVEWKSYTYGDYAFHYIIDDNLWFVCMADAGMGRRSPFAFLAAVQEKFTQLYSSEEIVSASSYSMNDRFRLEFKSMMEKFNSPNADRVIAITAKVKEINDVVVESIDKLMDREEKIDLLVDRSQLLSESSHSMFRDSRSLHRTIRWRNLRMGIFLTLGVLAVTFIIVWMSCGVRFQHC